MATDNYSSQVAVYLIPGMYADFWIPIDPENNMAMFPTRAETVTVGGVIHKVWNGFYVENEEVGTITKELSDGKYGVEYWHKKPEENSIWYISADPSVKILFSVLAVPIHDHSSIVQGGPAYGTYFSDDIEAGGE
jgi:hypothetical protein